MHAVAEGHDRNQRKLTMTVVGCPRPCYLWGSGKWWLKLRVWKLKTLASERPFKDFLSPFSYLISMPVFIFSTIKSRQRSTERTVPLSLLFATPTLLICLLSPGQQFDLQYLFFLSAVVLFLLFSFHFFFQKNNKKIVIIYLLP